MESKCSVEIGDRIVSVDPQLLFQCFNIAGSMCENLSDVFTYELCSFPPVLFETANVLLPAYKPSLSAAMWKSIPAQNNIIIPDHTYYILDGGYFLHHIPWKLDESFYSICMNYIKYIKKLQ